MVEEVGLGQLHSNRGELVKILIRQAKDLIVQASLGLVIPRPVLVEVSRIQRLAEAPHVTFLVCLEALPIPLNRRLVANRPVLRLVAGDTQDRLEHVPLADQERGDVQTLVPEPGQGRAPVLLVVRQDLEGQHVGNRAAAQGPRRRVDLGVAVVVEGDPAARDVEPVPDLRPGEAELVPEATAGADEAARPQVADVVLGGLPPGPQEGVPAQLLIVRVAAPVVRDDPGDPGGRGRLDQLRLGVRRGRDRQGDDQGVLPAQCPDEGVGLRVVDPGDPHAVRDNGRAVLAGDGGDLVLALLEEVLDDV